MEKQNKKNRVGEVPPTLTRKNETMTAQITLPSA